MDEVMAVSTNGAQIFAGGVVRDINGLDPATTVAVHGLTVTTLPDIGAVRSRVATANDVHFGEVECGKIEGVTGGQFSVGPGEDPYPVVMNRSVIAEITGTNPDAVIVKGDLTSFGTLVEYAEFCAYWVEACGDRLTYVRGNHDSYPGEVYADWPVQVRDVPGLRIVLLDTSRFAEPGGRVSDDQLAALDGHCSETSDTVIVMGHHPIDLPSVPSDGHKCLARDDSEALLAVLTKHRNVVAYTAGHTHRCRRIDVDGIAMIEVAAVKDFPGAWAEYLVGTEGIAQVVRRASAPDAVAWAEKTRAMFDGFYGPYAMGRLEDRCFTLPLRRAPLDPR